jgi:hypothetical protein
MFGGLAHRAFQNTFRLTLEVSGRLFYGFLPVVDVLQRGAELGDDLRVIKVWRYGQFGRQTAPDAGRNRRIVSLIVPSSVRYCTAALLSGTPRSSPAYPRLLCCSAGS